MDLSGHWQLNTADSDDPQRLIAGPTNPLGQTSLHGRARRGGEGAGRTDARDRLGERGLGPAIPPVSALSDGVRWPGKVLQIKQVGGAVAFA